MPAKNLLRVEGSGIYCHVYNKGIENRNIFSDEADYQIFLNYLEDYLSEPKAPNSTKKDFTIKGQVFRGVPHQPKNYFDKIDLISYNLKPNHFHLLVHQIKQKSLERFIRSLCTRYSIYYNKKYNRTGSLFEGPYKSVLINEETHLPMLVRYLHNAGSYSTLPEYSGQKVTPWVKTKSVLNNQNVKGNNQYFVENSQINKDEEKVLKEIMIEGSFCHLERSNPKIISHKEEITPKDITIPKEIVILKPWSRIPELLAASVVFVLLLGIGLRNVTAATQNSSTQAVTLGTKTTSTSSAQAFEPKPKIMITVNHTEEPINIRKNPENQSEKISEAKNGNQFELVSKNSNWYQVKLPDGSIGFILSSDIETGKTNSQSNE